VVRVALIDASSSTNKPDVRTVYEDTMQTIVSTAGGGDVLVAYPITSNSQASSYADVTVQFPTYNGLTENEDQYHDAQTDAANQAQDGIEKIITFKDGSDGTDLLFAFTKASDVFNGELYRSAKEKDLVVLTDGFQQTHQLDMMKVLLTPDRIQEIIRGLKDDGYLPNLQGVKVWMVGCGADPHHEVGPEKLDQVRRFWLAYFKACGANLAPERYGTTLENYKGSVQE